MVLQAGVILTLPTRTLDLSEPLVMGVLNATPDSFSDGGRYTDTEAAVARALAMLDEGARIIDVGGESTRPGSAPVSEAEELRRVVPVIEALRRRSDCVISIDTTKPAVMQAACAAGAEIINDINALRADGALDIAARSRAAVVLMHMQGEPGTMQQAPVYRDVCREVADFLAERSAACAAAGIGRSRLVLDPGFGFGKRFEHNLALLAHIDSLVREPLPILAGMSRKAMLGHLGGLPVDQRLAAGLAAATLAVWLGAAIVRTHDVRPTVDALRLTAAVKDFRRDHRRATAAEQAPTPAITRSQA